MHWLSAAGFVLTLEYDRQRSVVASAQCTGAVYRVPEDLQGVATFLAKADGVLAGLAVADLVRASSANGQQFATFNADLTAAWCEHSYMQLARTPTWITSFFCSTAISGARSEALYRVTDIAQH